MRDTNKMSYKEEIMQDRPYHQMNDYIGHDMDLLAICVILEKFDKGENIIYFFDLYKGNYWHDRKYIGDAVFDEDIWTSPMVILDHIDFALEDMLVGKVNSVMLDDIEDSIEDVVENISNDKEKFTGDVKSYYASVLEQLFKLKSESDKIFQDNLDTDPDNYKKYFDERGANVPINSVDRNDFSPIATEVPQHILLDIEFNPESIYKLKKVVIDRLKNIINSDREEDINFIQDIKNFYEYLKKMNVIGEVVSIPFSILDEEDFDAVKVLKFLELNNRISIEWSANTAWQVRFTVAPTSFDLLMHSPHPSDVEKDPETKHSLSFTEDTTILHFTDSNNVTTDVKIQGAAQKDVMRAFFKEPQNTYGRWTMYDLSELSTRKEKSVLNALFQLNNKVSKKLPSIQKFLEYNQDYAQINPKYVIEN